MEIYDLYADPFNLGDMRNYIEAGEVIDDPDTWDKYKVIERHADYLIIERQSTILDNFVPFNEYLWETRIHDNQEYMVQYCDWDKRWYAWGTEWNLNRSDETKEGAIKKFESLIDFFYLTEYPFLPYSELG